MNTSIVINYLKKFFHSLPEVWYIALFAIWAHSNIHILFNGGNWHSGNMFMTLFCIAIIALLIMQLLKRNVWSRFLLGMLFTFGSLLMFFALHIRIFGISTRNGSRCDPTARCRLSTYRYFLSVRRKDAAERVA